MNHILPDLLAFGAILSSLLVITAQNPVIAVLFLISVFVNSAGYLILLGVGFIGISYIIVYVGAIAILFLFILMMINIELTDILEVGSEYTKNLPLGLSVGGLFIYEMFTLIPFSFQNISVLSIPFEILNSLNSLITGSDTSLPSSALNITENPVQPDASIIDFTQIEALGQGLYTYSAMWLILTSLILLLAMISPIILSNVYKK
jgi:NADH-ubiquinone oxidoreductase chain 6